MADITMCAGGICRKKEDCYRYKAVPNPYWQSYLSEIHRDCDYFWPMKDAENAGRIGHRNGSIPQEDPCGSN